MHFPKSCLINEGRTRPARRCRAEEPALCVVRRGVGRRRWWGRVLFFPSFPKKDDCYEVLPPGPPLPLHPTGAPRLRAAHPFSSSCSCAAALAAAVSPRSRRAPAPGDDGRAGGEGPAPGTFVGSGGGGGSAGKPRAAGGRAGGRAAGGGGGGEEGGGRGAGGPGLLLHSPLEPTGFLYVRHGSFKKRRKKEPSSERPRRPLRPAPFPGLKEPRPGRERRARPGTHGAQGRGRGGRAWDCPRPPSGLAPPAQPGQWVARAAQASRAAAARWVCRGLLGPAARSGPARERGARGIARGWAGGG